MKNILVTGHEGFAGKHLTKFLDKKGLQWIGYDLQSGQDTRNRHDLDCIFEMHQIRHVIHLAALAGVRRSRLYPEEYISTNIFGTQNIVDMCNKYMVEKLVFYSSSSVFGVGSDPPFIEDDEKKPINLYGISKLAGEHIVNNAECKTVILRPFTIYGEDGRKDEVIYRWLEQYKSGLPITIYGDGTSCRGYVYIKDLVEATVNLLQRDSNEKHEDFNIGGSEIVYIQDIADIFADEFPDAKFARLDLPVEDVLENYANTDRAKEILGFDPQPNFATNLRKIIKEFKQNAVKSI